MQYMSMHIESVVQLVSYHDKKYAYTVVTFCLPASSDDACVIVCMNVSVD